MILSNYCFSDPIVFQEGKVNTLVIENPVAYRNFVSDMIDEIDGLLNTFVLSEDGRILEFSKNVCLITDLFRMDSDTKSINNKILQIITEEVPMTPFDTGKLITELNMFASELSSKMVFDVSFNEVCDLSGILKLFGFSLDMEGLSLPEKTAEYISFSANSFKKKLFVILNLKSIFSEEEQTDFFKIMTYKKIPVLLVETKLYEFCAENEVVRIIDSDLCELH